jgi:hypothetical protein
MNTYYVPQLTPEGAPYLEEIADTLHDFLKWCIKTDYNGQFVHVNDCLTITTDHVDDYRYRGVWYDAYNELHPREEKNEGTYHVDAQGRAW